MKSTTFHLDFALASHTTQGAQHIYNFPLPLLPAFAVEYFTVHIGPVSLLPGPHAAIEATNLRFQSTVELSEHDDYRVVLFYHGIREYRLLFPSVSPPNLQIRLGDFYREAESAFESGSWLAFMLLCGALFEGILFFRLTSPNLRNGGRLEELINTASHHGLIDSDTTKLLHKVRNYRNLVHAKRHSQPYVSRADAMDTRTTLDTLIRQLSSCACPVADAK